MSQFFGGVAQLIEQSVHTRSVGGLNPLAAIYLKKINKIILPRKWRVVVQTTVATYLKRINKIKRCTSFFVITANDRMATSACRPLDRRGIHFNNDEKWIPAFAGMTIVNKNRSWRKFQNIYSKSQRVQQSVAVLFFITFLFSSVCRAEVPEEMFGSFADKEKYQNIMVEKVLSADRIVLEDGKKIRLIGIKAPEPPSKPKVEYDKTGKPVEPEIFPENTIEEKAYAFAHKLLYGKRVRLVFDETKTDEKLVTLAYVFVLDSGIMANAEILRMGYADLQIIAPNFKYEDQLRAAYREARSEQRGLQSD